MREPILILSDLHLGHKASRLTDLKMLLPLFDDCKTLVLNGDTWQQLAIDFRDDGARLWRDLQDHCRERDIDVVCLPGNHDPDHGDAGWISLGDGAVAVTHGDCVYAEGAPWSRMVSKHSQELAEYWAAGEPKNIEERILLGRKIARLLVAPAYGKSRNFLLRLWDAVTPPTRALRMVLSWWCMVAETKRFSRRYFPAAKVIICGHFHRAGIWDDGKLLVINTGSYMPPGGALWCEWRGSHLQVGRVEWQDHTCRRGKILGLWRIG